MTPHELHDKLLAEKPEDAVHDAEACSYCNTNLSSSSNMDDDASNSDGGGDMKTYTEEEFNDAVQAAVASLKSEADTKIADLEAQVKTLADAAAEAEVQGEVAKVQAELDKAEIRVADAEKRYNDLVAYLEAEVTEAAEAAAREARKEARIAAVKEATPLGDDVIAARIERWVAMEDEAFEEMLEDWKTVSTSSRETELEKAPLETAMNNLREENGKTSVAADVFGARNAGIDIRDL